MSKADANYFMRTGAVDVSDYAEKNGQFANLSNGCRLRDADYPG